MQISPEVRLAITGLAAADRGAKLTFDASGSGVPHGNTVRNPAVSASVAVTLIAAAVAASSTSGNEFTGMRTMDPAGTVGVPTGSRLVSVTRAGLMGTHGAPDAIDPTTSTIN